MDHNNHEDEEVRRRRLMPNMDLDAWLALLEARREVVLRRYEFIATYGAGPRRFASSLPVKKPIDIKTLLQNNPKASDGEIAEALVILEMAGGVEGPQVAPHPHKRVLVDSAVEDEERVMLSGRIRWRRGLVSAFVDRLSSAP